MHSRRTKIWNTIGWIVVGLIILLVLGAILEPRTATTTTCTGTLYTVSCVSK